jgi:Zn-dependent metalloprotease
MPAGGVARALRDMLNPGTAYTNLPDLGGDPQPAHMDDFFTGSEDSGGVHINSGIPNKAFATFAMAVGGKTWDPKGPAEIWYETATGGLQSTATFQDFCNLTVTTAQRIAPASVDALVAAWVDVGLTPA